MALLCELSDVSESEPLEVTSDAGGFEDAGPEAGFGENMLTAGFDPCLTANGLVGVSFVTLVDVEVLAPNIFEASAAPLPENKLDFT